MVQFEELTQILEKEAVRLAAVLGETIAFSRESEQGQSIPAYLPDTASLLASARAALGATLGVAGNLLVISLWLHSFSGIRTRTVRG